MKSPTKCPGNVRTGPQIFKISGKRQYTKATVLAYKLNTVDILYRVGYDTYLGYDLLDW